MKDRLDHTVLLALMLVTWLTPCSHAIYFQNPSVCQIINA